MYKGVQGAREFMAPLGGELLNACQPCNGNGEGEAGDFLKKLIVWEPYFGVNLWVSSQMELFFRLAMQTLPSKKATISLPLS